MTTELTCWNCSLTYSPANPVCPRCGQAPVNDEPPPPTRSEQVKTAVKNASLWAKIAAGIVAAMLLLYLWNPSKGHKTEVAPPESAATASAPATQPKRDGRTPEMVKEAGKVCLTARRAKSITDCQITDVSQEIDIRAPVYTEQAQPLCDEIANLIRGKTGAFQGTEWTVRIFSSATRGYALAQCKLSTY